MSDYSSVHDESVEETLLHGKKRKQVGEPSKGFRLSGAAKEKHSSKLYSVAWSSDLFCSLPDVTSSEPMQPNSDGSNLSRDIHIGCFATCGGKYISLYEVDVNDGFRPRQVYVDTDDAEDFFTCVFGGRGIGTSVGYGPILGAHENGNGSIPLDSRIETTMMKNVLFDVTKNDGPQLLLVAGERGIVKIIDTVHRRLFMTLSGHGDSIYDLKISPCDTWLLLSASKDESIRLWNFMNATCIAVFTGHEAHKSSVLSISWHPLGKMFVSSSMDTSIKIWSLETLNIQENLDKSRSMSPRSRMVQETNDTNPIAFNPVFEQFPIYSTNKMHLDYVDCVQFVGDLILSKSPKQVISLWKPVLDSSTDLASISLMSSPVSSKRHRQDVIPLRDFELSRCNIWFIRFQTDSSYHYLACGNNTGEIKVYDLESKSKYSLTTHLCTTPVRMISFSPEQNSLIAVCDDASIWKWDLQL